MNLQELRKLAKQVSKEKFKEKINSLTPLEMNALRFDVLNEDLANMKIRVYEYEDAFRALQEQKNQLLAEKPNHLE